MTKSSKRPKHAKDISEKNETSVAIVRRDPSRGLFGTSRFLHGRHYRTFLEGLTGSSGGEIFNVSSRRKEMVGGYTYISVLETSTIGTTKEVKGRRE